ncbi:hypothetical protein RUND412_000680 [Rhizina undulata]
MSIFETPPSQRTYTPPGAFINTPVAPQPLYPDLPSELRNSRPAYGSSAFMTPERPAASSAQTNGAARQPIGSSAAVVKKPATGSGSGSGSTENLGPVPRAAKIINEFLSIEARYPQLDDIVSQGQSADYELPRSPAWEPFQRTLIHTIPDSIFDQYNRATSYTNMGLFTELKQAWLTVDNRLYLWDYATQSGFQGYEAQPNNITCVKLVTPRKGVFVETINYVLVIATAVDVFLLAVSAVPNGRGGKDVTLFETGMSVPTKGLDVSIIEGSKKTGRLFFGGEGDNDVYEFTYQAEEKWFYGRCRKVCHTSRGLSTFAPNVAFFTAPKDTEHLIQMIMDDTRNLLYTLSSKGTIRAFHVKGDYVMSLTITHAFVNTISNIRVMIGNNPLLEQKTKIVSISPVTAQEARRTHLIATTTTGCRLFLSAVTSEFSLNGADAAPTAMQVIHVRFPPPQTSLMPTRMAKVFPPGYFFCFVEKAGSLEKPEESVDDLFLSAPDSAKISLLAESGASRLQLAESGMFLNVDSRVQAVELISEPFAASKGPGGFGNETAVQFDQPPAEFAILTNSGVHIIRRRRLVEVFDAAIRYGSTSSPLGVEGEVRKFFETYGRAEGCASALAVACGAATDAQNQSSRITDPEVFELARKYFIEFGGKPTRAENMFDAATLPSLDSIKVSGRAEGLALYISRIVRSIWRANMIVEKRGPNGAVKYESNVSIGKLSMIQEQLVRLDKFLTENKSFIVGLSGAETLMGAGSRVEEVALMAEHRTLHSLVQLIHSMIEGISFVLFLYDDKLDDIIMSLAEPLRNEVKALNYAGLFTSEQGQALAKELVTTIVNRNIAAGLNVDTIADALRRRCGSFCSADDVVVFKGVELCRRAKSETDPDAKTRLLKESLRLFEQTAGSLSMENLREMLADYRELGYYPGAVQLALRVAKEVDRGNQALAFLADGALESDPREALYSKRVDCYMLIFEVLDELDAVSAKSSDMVDGVLTPIARSRNETWQLVYSSTDEVFHNTLYDWLFARGLSERLLEVESPFVLSYLQRKSFTSLNHADLLWQYHARRENFFEAAKVLHTLAQSDFDLGLEKRLEYFSRARGFCNSYGAMGMRQKMNELSHTIQEELDVAVIQDDVLRRVKEDDRISAEKKARLERELDAKLISLSDLFNKYADPYGYWDICLAIFQAADYRGANEIRKCWQQLIAQTHDKAVAEGSVQPFELVADTVRRLGQRFSLSEYIFPPSDLVPLLEAYAYEHQRDVGPPTWVVDALLDAGIPHETLVRILDDMFYRDEVPFRGTARRRLIRDVIYVIERWVQSAVRVGRGGALEGGFKKEFVEGVLQGYGRVAGDSVDRDRLIWVLEEVRRRFG